LVHPRASRLSRAYKLIRLWTLGFMKPQLINGFSMVIYFNILWNLLWPKPKIIKDNQVPENVVD
jgi:hypothetical protein